MKNEGREVEIKVEWGGQSVCLNCPQKRPDYVSELPPRAHALEAKMSSVPDTTETLGRRA